jgi:hypothetical protein
MVDVSLIFILAVGVIVCAFSAWGMLVPDKLWKIVHGVLDKHWGIHLAVIVRLLLGTALIIGAPVSRFPLTFEILGWIAIIAAVAILFIGRDKLHRFIAWFERFSQALIRVWLLIGIGFGAFLVYGVV